MNRISRSPTQLTTDDLPHDPFTFKGLAHAVPYDQKSFDTSELDLVNSRDKKVLTYSVGQKLKLQNHWSFQLN